MSLHKTFILYKIISTKIKKIYKKVAFFELEYSPILQPIVKFQVDSQSDFISLSSTFPLFKLPKSNGNWATQTIHEPRDYL